jgi:hypothetical protein
VKFLSSLPLEHHPPTIQGVKPEYKPASPENERCRRRLTGSQAFPLVFFENNIYNNNGCFKINLNYVRVLKLAP